MSSEKSTGNLYVNDYKKLPKQPDFTGSLEITKEQINKLIELGKAGEAVKLKLGMWKYPSKTDPNQDRFFLVAECGEFEKKPAANEWGDTPF